MTEFALGTWINPQKLSSCDCQMEQADEEIAQEVRTGSGALSRRFVDVKRRWAFRYAYLPSSKEKTADGGLGRDELLALMRGGDVLTLRVPIEGYSYRDVEVLFALDSWKEKLLLRDGPQGWVWEVSFDLEEV